MGLVGGGSVGEGTGAGGSTGGGVGGLGVGGEPGGGGGLVGCGVGLGLGAFVGCPGNGVGCGDGADVPPEEPKIPSKKPTGFGVGDMDGAAVGGGVGGATICISCV